jgi:hypothetical protein
VTLPATIKMIVTPKEANEDVGMFDIVEAPGHDRAITIPMNEPCIVSAYKNTENVNAKLTPQVGSSIRGQLAMDKLGIVRVILKAKVTCFWMRRIFWVTEWVRCIGKLEFDKERHFREIGLGISLQLNINGIDTDIRCKFVTLGIWIGVCIDELQFRGEWYHCSDLLNVSEA